MIDQELDARLAALFGEPARPADDAFVARVEQVLLAEQRIAEIRARAWRRFTIECVASGAVIVAFCLLWRLGPPEITAEQLAVTPGGAAMLVLLLWFGVELRPTATGR